MSSRVNFATDLADFVVYGDPRLTRAMWCDSDDAARSYV